MNFSVDLGERLGDIFLHGSPQTLSSTCLLQFTLSALGSLPPPFTDALDTLLSCEFLKLVSSYGAFALAIPFT